MLLLFSWQFAVFPTASAATMVTVPVGTPVLVVFNNPVDPASVTPGQTVTLSVVDPVVIDGATAIKAGAAVLGEISVAEKEGAVGKPAKVGIVLRHVTAVDGTNIPLTGMKQLEGENKQTTALVVTILCCVLGLLMKGGSAVIPAGAQIQATTMAPVAVTIAE